MKIGNDNPSTKLHRIVRFRDAPSAGMDRNCFNAEIRLT
jgi:hypothetical protein